MKNKNKNKEIVLVNGIKKYFYKGRMTKFKNLLIVMCVGGLIASGIYFLSELYINQNMSKVHIVLNYPEIAESKYPDGSRFIYYDLISDDKVEDALDAMHQKGMYTNFTLDDIKPCFELKSYLDGSASAAVSSVRSEGNDFSYVANEYRILYVQPKDYSTGSFKETVLAEDYTSEFLYELMEINKDVFFREIGGLDGFESMLEFGSLDNYDFKEEVQVYRTKIKAVVNYLNALSKKAPKFVASSGTSLKDVVGKYQLLVTNKLDGISNYIESTGIAKHSDVMSNKTRVNLESNALKLAKYLDRSKVYSYATDKYDHTFTENLINVVFDDNIGLYQARPKTAFDTITADNNGFQESIAEYSEQVNILTEDLNKYALSQMTPEEAARVAAKCERLLDELAVEYAALSEEAKIVVTEVLNVINKDFVSYEVKKESILSKSLIMKSGAFFALGVVVAFILCILFSVMSDALVLRKQKRLLKNMKKKGGRR